MLRFSFTERHQKLWSMTHFLLNILFNISWMKYPINWKSFTVQQFLSLEIFNKMCFQGHTYAFGDVTQFNFFFQLFFSCLQKRSFFQKKMQKPKYSKNKNKYWNEMKHILNNFWRTFKWKKRKENWKDMLGISFRIWNLKP